MQAAMAVIALVMLAGCGGGSDENGGGGTTTTAVEQVTLQLRFVTSNGLIAGNIDDESCAWSGRYEVSDGDGSTLAVGDLEGGEVTGLMPNYECTLDVSVDVDPSDFYDVSASGADRTGVPWDGGGTVSAAEASGLVTVTIS